MSAVCVACSALTSTDGLTGGGGDGGASLPVGTSDSGTSATGDDSGLVSPGNDSGGGGSPDTGGGTTPGSDAAVDDGGTSGDSGGQDSSSPTDSGAVSDTGTPTYCSTLTPKPLFCADFDEGLSLNGIWDTVTGTGGTSSLASGSDAFSAPEAMTILTNNQPKSVDCAGYKRFAPKASPAVYTLTSEIRIDKADTSNSNSDAVLLTVQVFDGASPNSGYWDLQLELSYASNGPIVWMSEDAKPADGGTENFPEQTTGASLPLGTWNKVALAVTVTGAGQLTGSLFINDSQIVSTASTITVPNPTPQIIVGSTFAMSAGSSWQVRYDNVTFTEE